MKTLPIAVLVLELLSSIGCQTAQVAYPLGSIDQAAAVETKRELLDRYGTPAYALRERDHWVYGYRSSVTDGYEIGVGPGGLLARFGEHHSSTDVFQFRIADDGRVLSFQNLTQARKSD